MTLGVKGGKMGLVDTERLKETMKPSADSMKIKPDMTWEEIWQEECGFIDDAPTVDPVKHGHWIEHHEPFTWMGYTTWTCSKCDYECGYEKEIRWRTSYCPNCGAKMDGGEE